MRKPGPESLAPEDIERRSFEILSLELEQMGVVLPDDAAPVVKRVIHTTADFDYARTIRFSEGALRAGRLALREGCAIVTDTHMARSGINKRALASHGGEAHCHVADEDVAALAREAGCTRSRMAVDKAASLWGNAVYAVGNAPTALIRICELAREGRLMPRLVIGVPVGFVNVVESKELLMESGLPFIVATGRKGGSNVAAAICNALLYSIDME